MKGRSNGAIAALAIWVAILFACLLAATAQAGRSPQLLSNKLASSGSNTTRVAAYHSKSNCIADLDDETKTKLLTIIFCTVKCYCHSDVKEDVCYCCQPDQGCYDTLEDCRAHCPACNPTCPEGTTADGDGQQQLHHATRNSTL